MTLKGEGGRLHAVVHSEHVCTVCMTLWKEVMHKLKTC